VLNTLVFVFVYLLILSKLMSQKDGEELGSVIPALGCALELVNEAERLEGNSNSRFGIRRKHEICYCEYSGRR
jgi:hypothetical protein